MQQYVRRAFPEVVAAPLPLAPTESACSYRLQEEHLTVDCGVLRAPAKPEPAACSTSTSGSSSESESSSEDGSDSGSASEMTAGLVSEAKVEIEVGAGSSGSALEPVQQGQAQNTEEPAAKRARVCMKEGCASGSKAEATEQAVAQKPSSCCVEAWEVGAGDAGSAPIVLYKVALSYGRCPSFLVLCCPTWHHIRPVMDHTLVREIGHKKGDSPSCEVIFHLSPAAVTGHPLYQALLSVGGGKCRHIIVAGSRRQIYRRSAARLVKLSCISPQLFPVPWLTRESKASRKQGTVDAGTETVVLGEPMMKVVFIGEGGSSRAATIDQDSVRPPLDVQEISETTEDEVVGLNLEDAREQLRASMSSKSSNSRNFSAAAALRARLGGTKPKPLPAKAPQGTAGPAEEDIKLCFLGTGSAAPSPYRGSSGILLKVTGEKASFSMLIDCGEGTFGHLVRCFGEAGAAREIADLSCMWVSHKHADHQGGVLRVLGMHQRLVQQGRPCKCSSPLPVIAPRGVLASIRASAKAVGQPLPCQLLPCLEFDTPKAAAIRARVLGGDSSLVSSLVSVPVDHCHEACGLVIHLKPNVSAQAYGYGGSTQAGMHGGGLKLVYSGDTRPCRRLARV
ncbi:unnamed protein product [Chrysoparadoxa australica]